MESLNGNARLEKYSNQTSTFDHETVKTMSSREIAELTGKEHRHVLRDCDVLNESYDKLQLPKIGQLYNIRELPNGGQKKERYFELTKMQSFDLMTGYSTELRIKVNRRWEELEAKQLSKPLSTLELLELTIKGMRETHQELQEVKRDVLELKARTQTRPEYFTVAGYATLFRCPVSMKESGMIGRKASKICKERGFTIDETPDARWGKVGMYPKNVLDEVFNEPIKVA